MIKETIIDNEFLTMWYYPSLKIVHHQFHQYMFGDPFREGLLKGAELLQLHGAQKWLSDDRKTSAVHPDDMEWAERVWFPRVRRAGWKYWALVLPEKTIGKMNLTEITEKYAEQGVTASLFADPDQAMVWLRRQ